MFWKRFYFVVILISCNCFLLCSNGYCKWLKEIFGRERQDNEGEDDTSTKNSNDKNSNIEDNQSESDSSVSNISQDKKNSVLKFIFLSTTTSVGKTSILKFLQNNEIAGESYEPTLGIDLFTVCFQEENMKIQFWDFSGNKKNITLVPRYLKDVNAIIFVYDITDDKSFNDLGDYIAEVKKEVKKKATNLCPLFLLGNKLDLTSDGQRQVTTDEAIKLATEKHLIFLGECSAKNNTYEPAQDLYCKQKDLIGEDGKCIEGLRGMLKDIIWSVHKNQNPSTS